MKTVKKFLPFFGLCFLIIVIFLLYLEFIGIPRTKALEFYNLALDTIDPLLKKKYLEDAFNYFPEQYIFNSLQNLQESNNF